MVNFSNVSIFYFLISSVFGQFTQTQKNTITNRHNALRKLVNPPAQTMPDLVWDDALATIAENWIKQCKSSDGQLLDHNSGRSSTYPSYVGENM
jgi:uncharacterized protein YkwD